MIGRIPRPARLLVAAMVTLCLMPCIGFSVFGLLASREPGSNGLYFMVLYMILLLVIFGAIALVWWLAVRRFTYEDPGHCTGCGYRIEGLQGGACPECGRPFAID
ncbi:MAG: hypothetical protein MK082_00615 [Phycisphaerales bacterium]|nr:hypothetical protein [Phycisphaerales bacterium]